jgi:hypothetical protein
MPLSRRRVHLVRDAVAGIDERERKLRDAVAALAEQERGLRIAVAAVEERYGRRRNWRSRAAGRGRSARTP